MGCLGLGFSEAARLYAVIILAGVSSEATSAFLLFELLALATSFLPLM